MAEPEKKIKKIPPLHGISYLADPIEMAEFDELRWKLETEFLDFLTCLNDLMELLHMIKAKYLRSMQPMPHQILRELRKMKGKSPSFRQYERSIEGMSIGITPSVDQVLRTGVLGPLAPSLRRAWKKREVKKRPLDQDLIEITGKKTKPMWHVVALEEPDDGYLEEELADRIVLSRRDLLRSRNDLQGKTRSETLLAHIHFSTSNKIEASNERFRRQMDMMEAAFAGFKTVDDHKEYLETLRPHWYTDLLKAALKQGVVNSSQTVESFLLLGNYYNLKPTSIPLGKAKLCFLVMSLPLWDVCRVTVQRSVEFILYEILKVNKESKPLVDWLNNRKIPYVVVPPKSFAEINETSALPAVITVEGQDPEKKDDVKKDTGDNSQRSTKTDDIF